MDGNKEVFLDTYALVEIFRGNPKFFQFKNTRMVITWLNLMEFYYSAVGDCGEEKAKEWYSNLKNAVVDVDDEILFEAMRFRREYKKQDISYADAVGYICAKKHNIPFVTGDKEFKDKNNVVFITK